MAHGDNCGGAGWLWRNILDLRSTLQPMKTKAGGYDLKEAADHEESTQEDAPGGLAESVFCGGPRLEQFIPKALFPLLWSHTGAVLDKLQSVRSLCWISS